MIVNSCLFHWKQAIGRKICDLKFDKPIDKRMMTRYVFETLTIIPIDEIEKYGIPYVHHLVKANCNQSDLDKMEIFWKYFRKYWMSSPSFIYPWNIHHQE